MRILLLLHFNFNSLIFIRDGIMRKYFKKIDKNLIKRCHNVRQFGERAYNQCDWLKMIMNETKSDNFNI